MMFFQRALGNDISVNDALDGASEEFCGLPFDFCALHDGFDPYWWNMDIPPEWSDSTLAIYGNGRMHLKNFEMYDLTVNAYDESSNPVSAPVYIDGDVYCGTTGNAFPVPKGSHTVRVGATCHVFHNFAGHAEFENPIEVQVNSATTVTANYYNNPPPQYYLYVAAGTGGTTLSPYTPGTYQLTPGIVTVTASPNSGYLFDHWYTCTGNSTDNPLSVTMTSSHYVQAIFKPEPTYKMVSSIYDYCEDYVFNPESMTGWEHDGQYATILNYNLHYGRCGWVNGTMNALATGHIYMYGYSSEGAGAHI
jgi:hypothetical protein